MEPHLSAEELARRQSSVTVVEALGAAYYGAGHIPGAVNLPPDRVAELAPVLLPDRDATIVVYGAHADCANARMVVRGLLRLGYADVRLLADGKQGWAGAGGRLDGSD